MADREAGTVSLKPVQGAVHGARLIFDSGSQKINIEGKATGRFRCNLPPATYKLTIQADGYQDLTQDYPIAPRKFPLWPKRTGVEETDEERLQPVFLMTKK